jgi:hypothetical protein
MVQNWGYNSAVGRNMIAWEITVVGFGKPKETKTRLQHNTKCNVKNTVGLI